MTVLQPEGELVENGHPILFALDAGDLKQTEMITIDYPDSLVEGSERALFTVFGRHLFYTHFKRVLCYC